MDATPKKRAYTKSRLIKELAFRAGISQRQSRAALEAIIEIAYREAKANYFILPGLCKFDVVRREPRKVRNPITGEQLMLPERDSLHVVLSKRAKETVAPRVAPMKLEEYNALMAQKEAEKAAAEASVVAQEASAEVVPVAEEAEKPAETVTPAAEEAEKPAEVTAPVVEAAEKPAEPAAPAADEAEKSSDGFIDAPEVKGDQAISFKCTTCGQEIIAPMETIGYEAECPACGAILLVPSKSEPGTTYAMAGDAETKKEIISAMEVEDLDPAVLKNRTIRIDALLFDEEKQPAPAAADKSTEASKSRTMRIDLPDEF